MILPSSSVPVAMEGCLSHHLITVPVAACAHCGREYPRDASAPTNLFCAGCRQSHHADAETELRRLRDRAKSEGECHATEIAILRARIVELEGFIDKVMDRFYSYMQEEGISLLGIVERGNPDKGGTSGG
jgi:hypothetical protein